MFQKVEYLFMPFDFEKAMGAAHQVPQIQIMKNVKEDLLG